MGWLLDGRIYNGGDEFIVYSQQTEFTALYKDSSKEATIVYAKAEGDGFSILAIVDETESGGETSKIHVGDTVTLLDYHPSGFVGWVYGASIIQGTTVTVSDERMVLYALFNNDQTSSYYVVTASEAITHPGSKIKLPIPAENIDNFRGWLVGGAFYYPYKTEMEVASLSTYGDAIPVFASRDEITIRFYDYPEYENLDGLGPSLLKILRCGESLTVPEQISATSSTFYGWYCDGCVYQPGDLFIALRDASDDRLITFVAMYSDNSTGKTLDEGEV